MTLNVTRREMLGGIAALAAVPAMAGTSGQMTILTAREGFARLAPSEYPETAIWGYDGGVPGPLIQLTQGQRLRRRLVNELPQPTAVHWHGVRVENAMDGVPGITQDAVPTGGQFEYDCRMPDAGTFWYHSHNQSAEQVARGLYGPLIVNEPQEGDVDHDLIVMVDDWRMTDTAQIHDSFNQMHDLSHAGRLGNYVHIEMIPKVTSLSRNDRLRVRFINPSTDRILRLRLRGMEGWVMALDGMPLETPQPLNGIVLAPAQRADVFADVTTEAPDTAMILQQEGDKGYVLAEFTVTGDQSRSRRQAPVPLPPNPVEKATVDAVTRQLPMTMEGGAMGGLREGIYKGQMMGMRELVENGQVWTLNGVAGLPDAPFAEVSLGETVQMSLKNETAFPHAMHLHGHHFRELRPDGTYGPLRDTLLVDRSQSREIVFVADNPGDWLFHCHMLSHQTAGMKTWLRVG
ncbi:multicopper oxidase family protein [Primorskyibacter sp. S87]|uniref:multicopper oxidase family protein n=1 Tax=Primorskyibacter sp. S87 TaxID=3415126 RepID=UPI003C7EC4E6